MFPPKKLQNCLEKFLVFVLPVLSVSVLEVGENTKRNFRIYPTLSIFLPLLVSNEMRPCATLPHQCIQKSIPHLMHITNEIQHNIVSWSQIN